MSQRDQQETIEELYALVRGWVQGVGYRYFVMERARRLGLRGYVRNDEDSGDVEVVLQGPRSELERLLSQLWQGPTAAQVRDIQTTWRAPTEHFSGFHIRY